MTHPFDLATALTTEGAGRFSGQTSDDYWNMVGPYGGITAAALLRALLDEPRTAGDPVALTVNYCAPVRKGRFDIAVEPLRRGRSTGHAQLRMTQTDPDAPDTPQVVSQAMAVTGPRRPLWGQQLALRPPLPPPPQSLARRTIAGDIRWIHRYDVRHAEPLMTPPAPGQPTVGWVRDDPPRPLDFPALAALADYFFPTIFALRGEVVPIATVSMNIYFHAGADVLATVGSDYLLGTTRCQICDGGFHDAESQLWHGDRLLLTTQQIIWYK